jgi:osmotically inducible protein OsmC
MTKPVYTAHARVTGGREDGRGRTPGGELDLRLRLPAALGGDGDGANPEQLFAVGYAACFEAAMGVAAQRIGVAADAVRDVAIDASVSLLSVDGAFELAVALDVELPSIAEPGLAAELVRTTHGICPYSRAVRGNVAVALTANGIAVTEPVPAHAA